MKLPSDRVEPFFRYRHRRVLSLASLLMELVWFNIFLAQQLRKWSRAGSVNAHHVCFLKEIRERERLFFA